MRGFLVAALGAAAVYWGPNDGIIVPPPCELACVGCRTYSPILNINPKICAQREIDRRDWLGAIGLSEIVSLVLDWHLVSKAYLVAGKRLRLPNHMMPDLERLGAAPQRLVNTRSSVNHDNFSRSPAEVGYAEINEGAINISNDLYPDGLQSNTYKDVWPLKFGERALGNLRLIADRGPLKGANNGQNYSENSGDSSAIYVKSSITAAEVKADTLDRSNERRALGLVYLAVSVVVFVAANAGMKRLGNPKKSDDDKDQK